MSVSSVPGGVWIRTISDAGEEGDLVLRDHGAFLAIRSKAIRSHFALPRDERFSRLNRADRGADANSGIALLLLANAREVGAGRLLRAVTGGRRAVVDGDAGKLRARGVDVAPAEKREP
ncbi:MAG: hypothetical protein ACR2PL_13485 [Dehalococcoidia bacterium]